MIKKTADGTEPTTEESAGLKESREELTAEREQLWQESEAMEHGEVFNQQSGEYSPAAEALIWLDRVNEDWGMAGATPQEHVLHTLETGTNVVDEGKLRELEAAAFTRLEHAWREGVPLRLTQRFIDALETYGRLADKIEYSRKAKEIATRIKAAQSSK
ncbi:hypothetical protein KKG41_06385 [Patescibacteria group bacterium]|nr:hypothetical protein [Patescibacteria group bacterium]MBU1890212.1 hypothetical protein [Patescibacteria group bacterium]